LPDVRRLIGLDRSGPPPAATRKGEPLRPWTLPNAIGFTRLALVPLFLVLALSSDDGRTASATVLFSVAAGSDYLDGLVARLTGQYSRLGTLLDPLVDRLVIVSGVVVAWKFELLPRWGLAVLAVRELLVLAVTQVGLRRGLDIEINWLGRWAVWPTMFSIWLALVSVTWIAEAIFFAGLGLTLAATVLYVRDFGRALARPSTSG
jgi:CDP-diacylglycerol--glycerol-3-phosphate 3-phosphatidyltransferase